MAEPAKDKSDNTQGYYYASMIVTAIVAPGLATAVMLVISIGDWLPRGLALLTGIGAGVVGWLFLAFLAKHFVTIHRANPAVYRKLYSRLDILEAQMNKIQVKINNDARQDDPIVYAMAEIDKYRDLLKEALWEKSQNDSAPAKDGFPLDWIGGFGYVRLWELLHRAEETRLMLAPLETVCAAACDDQLRLEGSYIDNRDALLKSLQDGRKSLDTSLQGSLQRLADERREKGGSADQRHLTEGEKIQEFAGREMLRHVRRSINEFRDDRRTSLVHARNRLLKTVILTEYIGFALAALAVLADAKPPILIAGTAFFLIGAVVGLFNQLHLDASTETAEEDYGLTTVRLLHTPLFSGLAALGGVLLMPLLMSVVSGATGVTNAVQIKLGTTFNLEDTPFNLILAAIFGLTPTILISRLQKEAEKYKADLRSSESLTRGPVMRPDSSPSATANGSSPQPSPQVNSSPQASADGIRAV